MKIVAGTPYAQGKTASPFPSRSTKLNCKGVIRELSNYIDGDLDPVVKQELERHLEHCEDCTMIVDQTKKTIQVLCDSQSVSLSADVRSRLHATLREKTGQKPT
ncbi:MAG: anti-sigma factor [Acidobacteria bacterium]|nr:MAG: anti-sigma factor [Acidobacteriota bacterium]